jgi:hypothetical protein
MRSGGPPSAPATSSSQTARQCCTRRICNWGIACSVSNNSGSATSAPVVNSVIPPSNQSGAFMHVSVANVRRRKLGAAFVVSAEEERRGGRRAGPPPSYMDSVRDSSWEEGLRRRLRTWRILRGGLRGAVCGFGTLRRGVRTRLVGGSPSANEDEEVIGAATAADANVDVHGKWGRAFHHGLCPRDGKARADHGPEFAQAERS